MLQAYVITLREGLEAFLIVAISLAFLRRAGRHQLVPAVRWGVVLSLVLSAGAAVLFQRAANQSLWEGILAVVAAVSVGSLTIHMWRSARRMKRQIEDRLRDSAARTGAAAFTGVFLFTVLMITREGMETALMIGTLLFQVRSAEIVAGAIAGTVSAAAIAWLWSRYGHRVNLARFFQVTGIFLLVFVVQLLVYAFHELAESGVLPNSAALHDATEAYGPTGVYGQILSYMLVVLPMAWLAVTALLPRLSAPRPVVSDPADATRGGRTPA